MRPPLADVLDLQPHPEGGWYRQTWMSPESVSLPDGRVRPTATLIHFLLPAGESSAWHRVASDEVWLAHSGTVVLELGGDAERPAADASATAVVLGTDHEAGEVAQVVVPAHVWQRTVPGPEDALVSCLVSPGFDFADFELDGPGRRGDGQTDADADGATGDQAEEHAEEDADREAVQRASAGPDEPPVDPSAPLNPA